jgi:antagonist of KipI
MSVLIRKPGLVSTVQDLGRIGYRSLGVNPNGPMDRTATRLINILLGNNESAPVIEMHYPAAEIVFERPAAFAIGGANFSAALDDRNMPNWSSGFAEAGSLLSYQEKRKGHRAYLAVRGGFEIANLLGSAATNLVAGFGGFEGRALAAGDRLPFAGKADRQNGTSLRVGPTLLPVYSSFPTVRIIKGAEFPLLADASKQAFLNRTFSVSPDSDRMGFRLQGPKLELSAKLDLLSSPVDFGTIQLLSSGQLAVLMADHQTAGGYPRVAHIISVDQPLIGQLGPGDKVGFHLVTIDEAEELALRFEAELDVFRVGCRLRSGR